MNTNKNNAQTATATAEANKVTAMSNAVPAVISNALKAADNMELSPVNKAILATVPEKLSDITSSIMKATQFSSGVSIALCQLLFALKSNCATELKTSKWKNYSNFCKEVLRLDPAQSSNYATMYERLFYDVDEPITKFVTDGFTVAQLVAIAKLKDRAIRTLFIKIVTADYSCTNINKAVNYLKEFNRQSLELNVIDWNVVKELLESGKSEKLEKTETATAESAETATAESAETATAETATAETATANSCKFTNIAEFKKWLEENPKAEITAITVTLK